MKNGFSPQEWRVRVDLAACYRLVDHYGMSGLVGTHISSPPFPTRTQRHSHLPDHHRRANAQVFEDANAVKLLIDQVAPTAGSTSQDPKKLTPPSSPLAPFPSPRLRGFVYFPIPMN